jgi:hypothetical protein
MLGYKAFESDMTCRGFQYEVGKSYEMEGGIAPCKRGFHFCRKLKDCFMYYRGDDTIIASVEAYGEIIEDGNKCVTNKIKILEVIPVTVPIDGANLGADNTGRNNCGNRNAGHWNVGNGNDGYYNVGDNNHGSSNVGDHNDGDFNTGSCNRGWRNTGNENRGNDNVGDWNYGNFNVGCFMTTGDQPTIPMFNKPSNWTLEKWRTSKAADIMSEYPGSKYLMTWICARDMTEAEKEDNPLWKINGGYLRKILYKKKTPQEWWDNLPDEDKNEVMSLPNFDPDIFFQCTGIEIKPIPLRF